MSAGLASIGERARDEGLDIGFVSMGFAPDLGGIETHLLQLAQEFTARGHRVHVLCLDSRRGRAPYSFEDQLHGQVRVRRVAYAYHDHRALADLAVRAEANDTVMAWLAEEPCDVVHVHHASGFGAGMLQAIHEMGRPLLLTLHDYWMLCPRGQMLRNDGAVCASALAQTCAACLAATWPHLMPSERGEQRGPGGEALTSDEQAAAARTAHALSMLNLPARLFAPSAAARDVFERNGVPAGRIAVLPNGVEVEGLAAAVAAARRATAPKDDRRRVAVLGSVQPSKGVLEFARAALSLNDSRLVIEIHGALGDYHGDSSYGMRLRELATAHPQLELHGEYAHVDLARILARVDLVCVPSRWHEVFGLTAREARAAGLPVFVSDRGGLADLRADPGVRLLAAEDATAWRNALEQFMTEPAGQLVLGPAPKSAHALALELESHYVELVRTQLGREPRLLFQAGTDVPVSRLESEPPASKKGPWWRRMIR